MSQYKSAIRAQQPSDLSESSPYHAQARQLQEFFPSWSNDDLLSLLIEVGGDVQLAATRISDGVAEQWGSVSRKKDKKAPTQLNPPKESFSSRGDFRGGRGGRGARGGTGRGGATGRGRGGQRGSGANGPARTASPRPSSAAPVNGSIPAESTKVAANDAPQAKPAQLDEQQNGISTGWGDAPLTETWGTTSSWGTPEVNGTPPAVNVPSTKVASKTPATSKMSWAQIAKSHEKSTPPPATQPIPTSEHPAPLEFEELDHVREEPTTVQEPSWLDEPTEKHAPPTADSWPPAPEEIHPEPLPDSKPEPVDVPPSIPEPAPEQPSTKPEPEPQLVPAPVAPALAASTTATPSPKLTARPAAVSHRNSARYKVTDQPVVMPSSFAAGVEKVGMQFGSLSLGGESLFDSTSAEPETTPVSEPAPPTPQAPPSKALPEPSTVLPPNPPATAPATSASLSSVFQQQQTVPQQAQVQPPTAPPPQLPISHHPIPASVSQPTQQPQSAHAAAATSPIQQFAQQQQAASQLANQQQQQQQHHHLPQQLQQQPQTHHTYSHGLPTHIDPSQQVQSPNQPQQLQSAGHTNYFRQGEATSAAPYFHTPTPPAGQAQESHYGSFAGQLAGQGQHQQASHLGGFGSGEYGYEAQRGFYESPYVQQSSFGRNVLGHDDVKGIPGAQQQPPTSAGLPPSSQASQQHTSTQAGQPQPGGAQGPQQGYPPPVPYFYTHPYPQNQFYGSPYSAGYGVPQPAYMKYTPTVFQPAGPPGGPGSAPSPATKQPGAGAGINVQPQTNPYSQGLYQQGGYEEYQPHPHHTQHQQHQHTHSLGLGQGVGVGVTSDYGKQLYGGAAQGGMQGFMGLGGGQSGAASAGGASNGPRGGASPETTYKSYVPKDSGINVPGGRGAVQQQQVGQVQGQPQGQGQQGQGQTVPQGQSFYGANRFSGVGGGTGASVGGVGVGAGVGGPQQSGHHQQGGPQGHLAYPQGANDGGFYSYQPRQQQYWQ